jgi:hypothetical protein
MPQQFIDEPSTPGSRIWRRSPSGAVGSAFVCLLFALLLIGILAGMVMIATGPTTPGDVATVLSILLMFVALMFVIGALLWLVARDMLGKRSASIRLNGHDISLNLRAHRSLANPTAACRETIAYTDIVAIETRQEAYAAQGASTVQRTFRLTRRSGPAVFLFEQRGLRSNIENARMDGVAAEIAERAQVPLTDLGMVQGDGGILAAWRVKAPAWSATSLSAADEARQWSRVHRVAVVSSIATIGYVLLRVFSGLWGNT